MPLPFSFSTQRQSFGGDTSASAAPPAERVMPFTPADVSIGSLVETAVSALPRLNTDAAFRGMLDQPRMAPELRSSTDSTNQAPSGSLEITPRFEPPSETMHFAANAASPPDKSEFSASHDWASQLEQMRNDVFGIAMSVSALSDRLDRLEQRIPQADIATLRGEIEAWLENHLHAAVEHCMHRIASHSSASATSPRN